jgi:outer membrane protein assembly factor BamB
MPGGLAALGLAAVTLVGGSVVGCSEVSAPPARYPELGDAARRVLSFEAAVPVSAPTDSRLRPEERGGILVDPARGWVFIGGRDGSVVALERSTLAEIWRWRATGAIGAMALTPDGHLIVGTDDGEVASFAPEAIREGVPRGPDSARGRGPLWRYETEGTIRTTPVVADGLVFVATSREQVLALDAATGEWRWQYEHTLPKDFTILGRAGLATYRDPERDAITLLTGFDDGRVVAIDGASGEPLWQVNLAPTDEGAFADIDGTPYVDAVGGEVVVSVQGAGVHALALADGVQRWALPMRGGGTIVRGDGDVYIVASSLEGVVGFERGGRVRWRVQLDPGALSPPVLAGDVVLVAHSEIGLFAFDVSTGELLARADVGSGVSGTPLVDAEAPRVYALTNRGELLVTRLHAD